MTFVQKDAPESISASLDAETRTHLRAIMEASPVGIAVFNAAERIVYANPEAERLFGVPVHQPDTLRCGDLVRCANRHLDVGGCGYSDACRQCQLYQAIRLALGTDGAPAGSEGETLIQRDAALAPIWIKFKVAPLDLDHSPRAILVIDDITAQKTAEEALRESESKYRSFFDSSMDAQLITEPDGKILEVNPAACRMFGRSAEEIKRIGRNGLVDLSDPRLGPGLETRRRNGKARGALNFLRADGTTFEADVVFTIFTDTEGREKTSMTIRDLTELRQAQAERDSLQTQLTQAQRLESVGRLAGGVAHDFNNLLSVILGYAQMMLADCPGDDPRRQGLQEIYHAGIRAKELTRQLLAFSRKQVLEMTVVDINTVVTGFQKLLGRLLGDDIELRMALAQTPLSVKADISQLEQVLMNLAINARDAMADGGVLTIETASVTLDAAYAKIKPGVTPGNYALIAVSDNGCGMDPRTRESIFEPFFTTKTKEKGTGLGLATTYGIVKQHRGNVWVYSEPGIGSTFKIYLPLLPDADLRPADDQPDVPQETVASATVLLAEDDPAVRRLAARILSTKGYTVIESENVADALQRAKDYAKPIDLVLTDVIMPEMKGPEVYGAIRHHHPEARVLYMSGYTDEVIVHQGVLKEGVAYIQKPFSVQELLNKVACVLR
jgi:PAS domain S-box-containing protein